MKLIDKIAAQALRVYGPLYEVRRGWLGWAAGGRGLAGGVWSTHPRELLRMLRAKRSDLTGWRPWVRFLGTAARP